MKYVTKIIKTRKDHKCGSCFKLIPKGSKVERTVVYPNGNKCHYNGPTVPMNLYYCGCNKSV